MNEEGQGNRDRRVEHLEKSLALCERERALLGYELHDGLIQQLVAASMMVDAAAAQLPADREEVLVMLQSAADRLRCALEEGRRLMRGIRPPALESGGLATAIYELADELRASGLDVVLSVQLSSPRLMPALETSVYRILQQALNNVQRHSGVARAEVAIREIDHQLELVVRDEGRGFDPQSVSSSRFGLRGIRERAALFGGTAQIQSAPGSGTTVAVQLPLDDRLLAAGA